VVAYAWVAIQRERWVRQVGPRIQRLFEVGQTDSAFALATEALTRYAGDSTLRALRTRNTSPWRFCTEPAGATVWRAAVGDTTTWQRLGTTPTDTILLPVASRIRFEKPGYRRRDLLATTHPHFTGKGTGDLDPKWGTSGYNWCGTDGVRLVQSDSPDSTMIQVPAGLHYLDFGDLAGSYGSSADTSWVQVPGFRIGLHEVTNQEYQTFVRAGGYRTPEHWEHPFVWKGKPLSWDVGIRRLVDRSGQAGPATWEGGTPAPGTEGLPVGGLSWYEAAAYAKFSGHSLPTIYHWAAAAGLDTYTSTYAVQGSNMQSSGPRPPSSGAGMSLVGAFDMAGNVREWVFNADQDGRRYALGGGWSDPTWVFARTSTLDPFDRSPLNGVRLADFPLDDPGLARAARTIVHPSVDRRTLLPPVSEAVYGGFLQLFDYDPSPLRPEVVSRDSTPEDWVVERILIDAAYGGERLPVVLYLPKGRPAPYQTVVYFPGSYVMYEVSSAGMGTYDVSFLIHSGRAVVWPVFKSTFERGEAFKNSLPNESVQYRDHVVMWAKDLRRTVDYLTTRADIDQSRLAYFGFSWGALIGPVMLAVEPRLRAGILYVGGLAPERGRPEVEVVNYLPRVRTPVLMINGREDPYFPLEESQRPMFLRLGTASEDKREVVVPGGHFAPRAVLIAETRNWLDRYLGPAR
jgi:dienelactone hydrolase